MTTVFAALLLVAAPAGAAMAQAEPPAHTPAPPADAADPPTPTAAPPALTPEVRPNATPAAETPPADVVDSTTTTLPAGSTPPKPAPAARLPLQILPQDPRLAAYEEFRRLYETANFDQALPYAKQVVEMSEQGADKDYELPIAYNNLGATQYQLGDYQAASVSYRTSLELLESTQGISSRRLVVPLAGLGAVYAAQDEHALAAELLDRALAVSRRANGLFNLEQLPLIEQVADSRYAIEDYAGVERERMYAVRIAEQNYGYGDDRTLPPILELAQFYESLREFVAARVMYLRARDVVYVEGGPFNPLAVRSLVGIARTHRMQYTMDPQTLDSQQPARDEITGEVVAKVWKESRVPPPAADRSGLRSVQTALELLRKAPDPPKQLLSETLIELGDWFQTTSRPNLALPYYEEAAAILEAEQAANPLLGNPLLAPRMVYYRPPVSAARGLNTLTGKYIIRKATFSFDVSPTGEPLNITVVSSSMSESQLAQSRRALSRAIYSPRFTEGHVAVAEDITFTSEWYEELDEEEAKAEPSATPVKASSSASN